MYKIVVKGGRRRGFCTIAGNNLTPAGFPQIFSSFRWLHSDSHSALVNLANFTYFLLIALRFSLRLWSHLYFWNIFPSSCSAVHSICILAHFSLDPSCFHWCFETLIFIKIQDHSITKEKCGKCQKCGKNAGYLRNFDINGSRESMRPHLGPRWWW